MTPKSPKYKSFLLRMWAVEKEDGAEEWRVTIEDIATHQTHCFSSMDKLYEFLDRQTESKKDKSTSDN